MISSPAAFLFRERRLTFFSVLLFTSECLLRLELDKLALLEPFNSLKSVLAGFEAGV